MRGNRSTFAGNQNLGAAFQLGSPTSLGTMSLNRHLRNLNSSQTALVCVAVLTLWVVRASGPSTPQPSSSLHSTVQCQSTQAKRQCLDQDGGFDSTIARQPFSVLPLFRLSSVASSTDQSPIPLLPDGHQYNRPPPQS